MNARESSQKVLGWAVFYDDGSVVTDKECEPAEVPIDGVQWILEFFENGTKRNTHGMDNYCWTGDSWAGGNSGDLRGWLRRRDRILIVLHGRWISDAEYETIRKRVNEYQYDG